MQTQTFSAGGSPRVTITGCQGALTIEFWDQGDFAVDSAAEGAISQEDAALVIHDLRGDMRLQAPAATEIVIENHHGDLRIATIDGSVRLRDIDGSVFVSGVALLVIERDHYRIWFLQELLSFLCYFQQAILLYILAYHAFQHHLPDE